MIAIVFMPKEIFPSSFECDCGHQSHFFENTIKEMKVESLKKNKKIRLRDSEPEEHTIVFYRGKMVEIICRQKPKREHKTLPKGGNKPGKKKKSRTR